MKDALFFLLVAIVFTLLIAVDLINGAADLRSVYVRLYLGVTAVVYAAAIFKFVQVILFWYTKKKLAKRWGSWRSK